MRTIIGNQFGKNAAAKAQLRSDRRDESDHIRFIELCGSQAQNNRGMVFAKAFSSSRQLGAETHSGGGEVSREKPNGGL